MNLVFMSRDYLVILTRVPVAVVEVQHVVDTDVDVGVGGGAGVDVISDPNLDEHVDVVNDDDTDGDDHDEIDVL